MVMQGVLSIEEQMQLLDDSLRTMPPQKTSGVKLGMKQPPDTVLDWPTAGVPIAGAPTTLGGRPQLVQPACLDVAAQLLDRLGGAHCRGALSQADSREPEYLRLLPLLGRLVFGSVWARVYTGANALGWHRDPYSGIRGWVCLVNLGADATLAWRHGGQGAMIRRARLTSGDAIFFNGGILEHAVEEIHHGTCPDWWHEAEVVTRVLGQAQGQGGAVSHDFLRVGLQMRAGPGPGEHAGG